MTRPATPPADHAELVGPTTTVVRTADENSKPATRPADHAELVGPTTTVVRTADENSNHDEPDAAVALAERLDR